MAGQMPMTMNPQMMMAPPVFKEDVYARRTPDIYRMAPPDSGFIAPVPQMPPQGP
jgi:hypothetical protein